MPRDRVLMPNGQYYTTFTLNDLQVYMLRDILGTCFHSGPSMLDKASPELIKEMETLYTLITDENIHDYRLGNTDDGTYDPPDRAGEERSS